MAQRTMAFAVPMLRNLFRNQIQRVSNSALSTTSVMANANASKSESQSTTTSSTTSKINNNNNSKNSEKLFRHSVAYIDERVNHVFNTILADIESQPNLEQMQKSNIFNDPYKFKDLILQELISNSDINQNFNIHELIEEEFQLEISDQEFQQFRSLSDIVQYVNERLEIRRKLANNFSNVNLNQPNLTY